MDAKQKILECVETLIAGFLFYDRDEDKNLPRGAIEEALRHGTVTIEQLVGKFEEALRDGLGVLGTKRPDGAMSYPPVTGQTLHDVGLNPFAVQLLAEAYANHPEPKPVTFSYESEKNGKPIKVFVKLDPEDPTGGKRAAE